MCQALQQLSPHLVGLMAVQPLRQLVLLVQLPHLQVCFGFDIYSFPIMIWRISGLPETDFRSDFRAFVFSQFFLSNHVHILFIRVFKYVQLSSSGASVSGNRPPTSSGSNQRPPSAANQRPPSTSNQRPPSTATQRPPSTSNQRPPSTSNQRPPSTASASDRPGT